MKIKRLKQIVMPFALKTCAHCGRSFRRGHLRSLIVSFGTFETCAARYNEALIYSAKMIGTFRPNE